MSRKRYTPGPVLGYYNGIPIVPVSVERGRQANLLRLAACPLCGRPHVHGGGPLGRDPREFQGHRTSHCPMPIPNDRGYILRIVDGQEAVAR
jgi:hypothetical protein